MEPVLKAITPVIGLVTAYLVYRGVITQDQSARIGDLAAAAATAIGGSSAIIWTRSRVTPVKKLPDGSWGAVSDAAIRGNVPLDEGPSQ